MTSSTRLPVLFVGHGSPINAIQDNTWSQAFQALGLRLPRARGILAVSAHWFVPGTFLTVQDRPPTIHDFGGFPQALSQVQYPAPGSPDLARQVVSLLGEQRASLSTTWGLDHGTWSVLRHLRPQADTPVVQLSMDERLGPADHLAVGRALTPLRDQGVLILGSGNVTHNLPHAFSMMRAGRTDTPAWATRFDDEVARALEQHDTARLVHVLETDHGRLAHPTWDHYLPLLYAAGAVTGEDAVSFPVTGFDAGSLSMRAACFG
jgi:4,5-DOPA dioxygenase extradiol